MNTPIVDFLNAYAASGISRLHMPGHKGHPFLGPEPLDITEIAGADELYAPEGIIAESERNATALFGTAATLYSTEGSSHGIRSMLILAKQHYDRENRNRILAARNVHKAFIYALAILGCEAEWIYPSASAENSIAACQPTPERLREALMHCKIAGRMPFAVYVTSPDYLGQVADIAGLSAVAGEYNLPLLVDGAHGAYLRFLPESRHPMDLGAAMCCDSAHKTLPVLTGGAYLHLSRETADRSAAKTAMEMTGTTSPSYLIMASLDLCNRMLAETFPRQLAVLVHRLDAWREELQAEGIPILSAEPMKIVVNSAEMGYTGKELGDILRVHRVEPEFCDADYLVCMLTPETKREDLERLGRALLEARRMRRARRETTPLRLAPLERFMGIREAVFSRHEEVPLDAAEGRICGAPTVSCPPAVPMAVSGERLTREAILRMKAYGKRSISVVAMSERERRI